ncbi:retrovirus-related pol polyprotein from transposon TNT 1-94, partial [Tanacetum coccineum]
MGDENPIRTLGDYSKPSHEGYRNTIELPVGNNVVPLRSDTIRLVQNGCSFHGLRSEDPNSLSTLGTAKFGNDQIAQILGYGDLVQGKVTIKRVYYVEGLNHNLFSVGQFCDADLEVAFQKSTCYICDLKGNVLLTASSSQAWLWHRRLSHLNFDTINLLLKYDIVTSLPKLKFIKDHSSCKLGKAKRYSTQSRAYKVYNKRTRVIVKTIHVNFDELPNMASDRVSSDPVLQCPTMALEHASLSLGPQSQEMFLIQPRHTVLLGDNRACAIMGIGKVRVQMKDGSSFVLENVRYIPELKRNLISLGTLYREGYTVKLQNGRVNMVKASVGIQEKESLAQVWHKRLGHISEAGLHELERRDVLGNKGLGKPELCENCALRKSTRVCFSRGQHTTKGVIDYVHADLWGPSRVESMSGYRYFLSIVDDYSRRVERNNLCKESGIARHLTVAGTPQQNGPAERMNRTLLNKVRSPFIALEKKTPMDLCSGHPVNYEMLRIFSCVAYSYVNQGKLKPRAIKCIFLGDVVFNKSLIYKDTLKGAGTADSRKEVEFEVELQGNRVEPTVDPYTGENPGNEDEEQDEEPQQQNLDNYVMVLYREKRTTTIPARYMDEGNVSLSRPSG